MCDDVMSYILLLQEIGGVQRTFTSRIAGIEHLDYWRRLKKLSLMSLQRRRERYILLHMRKILRARGTISNDLKIKFTNNFKTLVTRATA